MLNDTYFSRVRYIHLSRINWSQGLSICSVFLGIEWLRASNTKVQLIDQMYPQCLTAPLNAALCFHYTFDLKFSSTAFTFSFENQNNFFTQIASHQVTTVTIPCYSAGRRNFTSEMAGWIPGTHSSVVRYTRTFPLNQGKRACLHTVNLCSSDLYF